MIYKYTLGYIPLALKMKCLLLFMIFVSLGSLTYIHASNPNQPVKAKTSVNIINPGLDPVIILSQNTATLFSAANSTAEVNVTSNVTWSASSDQSWLAVSPLSATGNGTLTFTADANTGIARTATVTVSGTGLTDQTIIVRQLAEAPSLSFASSSSGSLSIGLQFNANGSFYIDWGNGTQELKAATIIGDTYSTSSYVSGHTVKIYGTGITNMTASSMNLTWLDATQCSEMSYLNLAFNSLTTLDVRSNMKLTNLNCSYNSLSSIDVSRNSVLNELRLAYNNLGTLNVSNNSALTYLDCSSNKIATLDISNLTALTKLFCNSNKIGLLDVSKNGSLSVLNCNINNFDFVTLPQRKVQYSSYSYTPQARIPATINGNIVDLSRQLSVNDINNLPKTTVYKWYTKPGVQLVAGTDYKESNGVFTFQNTPADSVYCTMTNTAFPVLIDPNALRTVNIKVQLVLPQVSMLPVNISTVGSTQAPVNGSLDDFGVPNPTSYGICWNTTGSPSTTDSKVDLGVPPAIGPFPVNMTGLTAYTTYYLRAFATNLAGTAYGNEVTFTTNGLLPSVITDSIRNVRITKAKGYGNITDLGAPNPTQYGFVWSTSPSPTADLATRTSQGPVSAIKKFTSNITGLLPNTTYYGRAYATNTVGTNYGPDEMFTTLTPAITTPVPTSLSNFMTTVGTASTPAKTFVIGGILYQNLVITAPAGFEVRESGIGTFGNSVSFSPDASETVTDRTIEIRLAATAPLGPVTGDVVCSSTGAVSQNVALDGIVKPVQLTVSPPTVTPSKPYDGNTLAAFTPGTLTGILGTDDVSLDVLTTTATYPDANAGIGKTVTVHYTLKGADANKYIAPVDNTVLGDITQAPLTVTAVADTKVYDGTTISGGMPTIGTLISGDVANILPSQVFDTPNAGTAHVLIPSGLTLKNAANADVTANYLISYVNSPATGVINQLGVTVTAVTDSKIYNGTTSSVGIPVVGSLLVGDAVTNQPIQVFDTPEIGTAHQLIPSGLTIKDATNADVTANYLITYVNSPATGVIDKLVVTVTAIPTTKPYDATIISSGSPVVGSLATGDVVSASPIQVYDNPNYGTAHILIPSGLTIKNGSNANVTANYTINYVSSSATGVINKFDVTVTAITETKPYDGTTASSAHPVVGLLLGTDVVNFAPIQVFDSPGIGTTHVLIPSGLTIKNGSNADVTANYAINYINSPASGVINKLGITVTGITDTKNYDGTVSSSASPIVGFLASGDAVSAAPVQVFDTPEVGTTHVLIPSGLTIKDGSNTDVTGNYTITYINSPATGVISKLSVTVTAISDAKPFDKTTFSAGNPSVGQLAPGDVVSTSPVQVFDTPNVGNTHILIPSGLAIKNGSNVDVTANYTINYVNSPATGMITKLNISVTAVTDTKTYTGNTLSAGSPVVGALLVGDVVNQLPTQVFDTPNAGTTHLLIPSGLTIKDGSNADVTANYDITYLNSPATGVINQLGVTVTAVTDTKTYDGTTVSTGVPVVGLLLAGNTVSVQPKQVFDTPGFGITHALIPSGLSIKDGSNADVTNNYAINYVNSPATGVINPLGITVTAVTDTKTYDGTISSAASPIVGSLASGDVVNVAPVQVFDTPIKGTTHILTPSGLTIKDAGNANVTGNYAITYINSPATGVINKLTVTVTAVTDVKIYDATVSSAASPQIGSLGTGDAVNIAPVQVFDSPVIGNTHTLTASGLTIKNGSNADVTGNYTIVYISSPATGIINKIPLTITAVTDTKTYNGTTLSAVVPVVGALFAGDVVNVAPIQVFDTPDAGITHVLIPSGLTIKDGSNANVTDRYAMTYVNSPATGVINKLAVTVTAVTNTKTYDGNNSSTGLPLVGALLAGEVVSIAPSQVFDTPYIGITHVLIPSGLVVVNGSNADVTHNYAINYVNSPATGVINKKNLTVTAVTDTKIYDGTVNSLAAPMVTPLAASDMVSTAPVQVFDSPFVGSTHTLTASGLTIKDGSNGDATGNYNITYVSSPATGVIDKLVVTVTAVPDTKTYDATVNSSVVPLIGSLGIGDVPTLPIQIYDSPVAGTTHVLTPSGLSVKNGSNVDVSGNYTIIYVNTSATGIINKYNVSVTAVMDTKTYDATVTSARVPVVGVLLAGQLVKAVPTQVFDDPNAGSSHVLIPSGLTVKDGGNADVTDNYAITYVNSPATGVINKFNVTVTAVTDTKIYDGTTVSVGVPVVGALLACEVVNAYPVQVFDIPEVGTTHLLIASGLTVKNSSNADVTGNYAINYVNSPTGVITKRDLTVTAVTDSKTYDATVSSVGSPLVGALATGDVVNAVPIQVFDNPLPGTSHVLTPSGLTIKDGSNVDATGNYRISYISSPATGIITTRVLTISDPIISTHKVLDGNTTVQVTPGVITGLAPADVGNVTLIAVANYDNANLGTDKTITVVYSLTGSAAGNYIAPADYIIYSGVIGPMTLTLSNPSINTVKEYDGNNSVIYSLGVLTGLKPADAPNVILTSTASYDNANAGTGKTITVSYGLSGSLAGNYIVPPAYTITTGVITPKPLVVVSLKIATNKVYDSTNTATYTVGDLTGVVPLDAGNVILAGTAVYDNANAGTGKNITVSFTLSGSAIANYTVPSSYTITNGVIKAKQLTIADPVVVTNKMVDGNTSAAITTLGNILGVEALDANNVNFTAVADYDTKNVGVNKTITVVYTLNGTAMGNYIAPVDFVIAGAKISDFVVLSPLITPTNGCEGSAIDLAYDIMTGTPTQYKITFDAATLAAGILNVSYTNLPSSSATGILSVNIPTGTKDGIYKGTLQFINELGVESPVYDFQFTINVSTDYIIPKFDDVVLIDNSSNRFVGYQWFKDGLSIHGATKQFYNDLDGLVGAYSVRLTTADGQTLYTCSKVLNIPLAKNVSIFPSPVKKNQVSTIKLTGITDAELDGADLSVYTMQGTRVYQTSRVQKVNSINLPPIAGMYVGHVTTSRGQELQFKVIVIE